MDKQVFDYYYGDESNIFSFYRIPRYLITSEQFKKLSTGAKLLYGLLLDRMGLSAKNGWYDELGRVYIYYTLDEIQADLGCGHEKAGKLLAELDTGKGFGLIERIKQGQGRPAKIYVKRFTPREKPLRSIVLQGTHRPPIYGGQDFGKSEAKTSENQKPRLPVFGSADFRKPEGNYIKSNQTDFSQLDPSIHPSPALSETGLMDWMDCKKGVQENIDYETLCARFNHEDVDEVVGLITDVLCSTRPTLRISGEELPTAQVKERFHKLDNSHLEYVFDCLRKNTTKIHNIRAYLLTTLYNAPTTINSYYQAEIQHDFST